MYKRSCVHTSIVKSFIKKLEIIIVTVKFLQLNFKKRKGPQCVH